MRRAFAALFCAFFVVMCAGVPACRRDTDERAEKEAAKKARDAELVKLSYPASSGVQPAAMSVTYDGAADRTAITLKWTGLKLSGGGASGVSGATMYLTSSHKGRVRAADKPEGAVDGSFGVQGGTGVLAFSGAPGRIVVDGNATELKGPAKGDAYVGGSEELVRFRVPTEAMIAAASAGSVVFEFATVKVELTPQQIGELRELVARMKPGG
ncbi:MAG TPA: hypothetical protein VD997_13310 [Phycisphaerales bacterium]|nr:hypothetical protein [Phycisphaerales bacterium]